MIGSRWTTLALAGVALAVAATACGQPQLSPSASAIGSVDRTTAPSPIASQSALPAPSQPAFVAVEPGLDEAQVGGSVRTESGWLIVGSAAGRPAVWESTNGLEWRRASLPGADDTPGHLNAVTSIATGHLAVGWLSIREGGRVANRPLIAISADGHTWVTSSVGQPAETALTAVAAAGVRIVAAGSQPDGKPVTWRSNDRGATWQGPEPVPADGGSSVAALITIDGHFVAVGELVGAAPGAAVWRSSDGLEWVLDASVRGGGGLAAAAAGSVAAVAAGNDGHGEAAVWSIVSGSARQVVAPPFIGVHGGRSGRHDRSGGERTAGGVSVDQRAW